MSVKTPSQKKNPHATSTAFSYVRYERDVDIRFKNKIRFEKKQKTSVCVGFIHRQCHHERCETLGARYFMVTEV